MSRTPAKITQADVARTIRAAKQAGAAEVKVRLSAGSGHEWPAEADWFVKGDVYFVACGAEWIKIGFATDMAKRLKALQAANPIHLTLLHTIRGTLQTEREFHTKFASIRGTGEWFRAEPELLAFIESLKVSK
jgi:hypothetical protein